jgi:hypothetical protein
MGFSCFIKAEISALFKKFALGCIIQEKSAHIISINILKLSSDGQSPRYGSDYEYAE